MTDTVPSAPEGDVFTCIRAAVNPDGSLDMTKARDAIMEEHERATTTAQYVTVLKLHKWFEEGSAKAEGPSDAIADLLKACGQQYAWFLASECLARSKYNALAEGQAFDDQICPRIYEEIVRREVAAGRMSPDNQMFTVISANAAPPAPPKGFWYKFDRMHERPWLLVLGCVAAAPVAIAIIAGLVFGAHIAGWL